MSSLATAAAGGCYARGEGEEVGAREMGMGREGGRGGGWGVKDVDV